VPRNLQSHPTISPHSVVSCRPNPRNQQLSLFARSAVLHSGNVRKGEILLYFHSPIVITIIITDVYRAFDPFILHEALKMRQTALFIK
jgi:hypothetical protein